MQSKEFEATHLGSSEPVRRAPNHAARVIRPITVSSVTAIPAPHANPAPYSKPAGKKAIKSRRRWRYAMRSLVLLFMVAFCVIGLSAYWGYQRARAAQATYHEVAADVQSLQSLTALNFSAVTPAEADQVHGQFVQLQHDVTLLDEQTNVPARLKPFVVRLPYIGPRYVAAKQVITVVAMLADSGTRGSAIGQQALEAYKKTGLSSSSAPQSPTWLDVISQQMPQIVQIKNEIDQALQVRAQIDESVLPASARAKLDKLDQMASSHDLNKLIDTQLPALQAAFGGDGPARYLVLIQNPSELRPSGGFPGTIAIVTFDRGQLRSYEFYDVYDLNLAYTTNKHDPVAQPWPLSKYAPSPELSILDASWWSDFPTSAATIMQMYQTTGWPPIKGVVALDPAVVSAMLRLSGPMTIDVDGEMRTITADNVHDEIERQRRLARDGQKTEDVHKQVVAIIGKELIDRFKSGDRSNVLKMVDAIKQTADNRDLQVYSSDQTVQALIEQHRWAGKLIPDPSQPTIAVTFANVAFGKSSELMEPTYTLTLGPSVNGVRPAHLEVSMVHTGSPTADPFYSGFQRWWVDVTLPKGSVRTGSSVVAVANPDEPNGGSYEIPLMPGTSSTLSVDFVMSESSSILIRRQPGLHTAQVQIIDQSCRGSTKSESLSADLVFDLDKICAAP